MFLRLMFTMSIFLSGATGELQLLKCYCTMQVLHLVNEFMWNYKKVESPEQSHNIFFEHIKPK